MLKALYLQLPSKYEPVTLLNGRDIIKKQQKKPIFEHFEHIRIPIIGQKVHKFLKFFENIVINVKGT